MSLVGEPAPDFELESTAGRSVCLSETLDGGPTAVIMFRGQWCSFCAEQLQTFSALSYDLWRHYGLDVLPVAGTSIQKLVEMRDVYDLRFQLLADPEFAVTREYTEVTEHPHHGEHTRAGLFVVDPDGIVRYEYLTDHSADRRYANFVRYLLKNDYEDPYFSE